MPYPLLNRGGVRWYRTLLEAARQVFLCFITQTMVNIVPSYHPIARAKLSGQAKQRDALVFGHDLAPNIYFFGHDFASNRRSFGGSPLQFPPHNDNT